MSHKALSIRSNTSCFFSWSLWLIRKLSHPNRFYLTHPFSPLFNVSLNVKYCMSSVIMSLLMPLFFKNLKNFYVIHSEHLHLSGWGPRRLQSFFFSFFELLRVCEFICMFSNACSFCACFEKLQKCVWVCSFFFLLHYYYYLTVLWFTAATFIFSVLLFGLCSHSTVPLSYNCSYAIKFVTSSGQLQNQPPPPPIPFGEVEWQSFHVLDFFSFLPMV